MISLVRLQRLGVRLNDINIKNPMMPMMSVVYKSTKTNQEVTLHRALLFEEEKQRQLNKIKVIDKIEVKINDPLYPDTKLIMNKSLSTPYHCAMHLNEIFLERSVLAQVDDEVYDMHRPLENNCELKFLHFKQTDPHDVNNAYWRSCSFLLGYLLESSFKKDHFVDLCSFPPPKIQSGSFVYDAQLNLPNWNPTKEELRCMSISASKIKSQDLKFERLEISSDLATEMFKFNKFKLKQIPAILEKQSKIVVYKLGDFVDISKGPMISTSSLIGRFEVTGLFDIETEAYGPLKRLQGVSIPKHLNLHYWTFSLLAERASKLNNALKPSLREDDEDETKSSRMISQ